MERTAEITTLLTAWQAGDGRALEQLSPFIYEELRRLARGYFRGERPDHTLQATALVHEAFLRIADANLPFESRAHFFAVAARMMRRILVDHARGKHRHKRGGEMKVVSLDDTAVVGPEPDPAILELDAALERLSEIDSRPARAVELLYFGGLTYEEAAEALSISRTQLVDDVKFAKAWLSSALG